MHSQCISFVHEQTNSAYTLLSKINLFILTEGIDFMKVFQVVAIRFEQPHTVTTIARNGIQPTRSFTVLLRPDPMYPLHDKTIINGTLTINILDNSSKCHLIPDLLD